MISKVIRSEVTIAEDGDNADIVWKPDGTALVVITDRGFLHFYDVLEEKSKILELQFATRHHYVTGAGEGLGVPHLSLRFKMALEIDTGINRRQFCRFRGMSLSELEFYEDHDAALLQMVTNSSMDLFAWVSADGRGYVTQKSGEEEENEENEEEPPEEDEGYSWAGLCFYNRERDESPATCIALNSKLLLIAIGDSNGSVAIYSLSDDRSELRFSHRVQLSVQNDYGSFSNKSAVNAMEWSSDGRALAVGYKSGGLAVWSAFGKLLIHTMVNEDDSSGESGKQLEGCSRGIISVFWGEGNYDLFALPTGEGTSTPEVTIIQFLHSSLVNSPIMGNVRNVSMVSDDRLFIYEGNNEGFDMMSADIMQWESVQIPVMYITSNWPIKYVSMNVEGNLVAIAGRRGLAHFNVNTKRWKLFGNEAQEQSFAVRGGMLWVRDMLVVGTEDMSSGDFEIRIFSKDANLDVQCLYMETMTSEIITMSNIDDKILTYTQDNVMRFFAVEQYDHVSVESLKCTSILLLKSGELSLLQELPDGSWEHLTLSDKIEFFQTSDGDCNLENMLWAFGYEGLKVWINMKAVVSDTIDDYAILDIEFYPLSIMFPRGFIFGLDARMNPKTALNSPIFQFQIMTRLFLHTLIKVLLRRKLDDIALAFSRSFEELEYFGHALEVLLYQTLDEESEKREKMTADALLPVIVKFLNNFSNFLDVVAGVARKSEATMWPYFFGIVGDPKSLFERAINANSVRTATSYLVVIQTLESAQLSGEYAVTLLEKACDSEEFDTVGEVLRFFSSIEGKDREIMEEIITRELQPRYGYLGGSIVPRSLTISGAEVMNPLVLDSLLRRHARYLLSKSKIRRLGRLTRIWKFPLKQWLESQSFNGLTAPWYDTFLSLHGQFHLPVPDDMKLARKSLKARQRRNSYSGREEHPDISLERRRSVVFEGTVSIFDMDSENAKEVRILADIFFEAQAWEWAILLSTIVLDTNRIQDIVNKHPQRVHPWQQLIMKIGGAYRELLPT
ncbi:hypothetical protein HDU76_005381 [Blyttiomyces sp. JEL0837]|nr:hypothetical protein HDU76_005381 [Blyttiomyces sp. JEL0837]